MYLLDHTINDVVNTSDHTGGHCESLQFFLAGHEQPTVVVVNSNVGRQSRYLNVDQQLNRLSLEACAVCVHNENLGFRKVTAKSSYNKESEETCKTTKWMDKTLTRSFSPSSAESVSSVST